MKVYPDDKEYVFYDIDNTLIFKEEVQVTTPEDLIIDFMGTWKIEPNYEIIEQLKDDKKSGKFVVTWHAGGTVWPKKVLKLLKLDSYVDLVIAKPSVYYDDDSADEILGTKGMLND